MNDNEKELTKRDPGGDGSLVEPEGNPGDDDKHAAWDVDLDEVVAELAFEEQVNLQAAVLA
jgi:hypothetical protein